MKENLAKKIDELEIQCDYNEEKYKPKKDLLNSYFKFKKDLQITQSVLKK